MEYSIYWAEHPQTTASTKDILCLLIQIKTGWRLTKGSTRNICLCKIVHYQPASEAGCKVWSTWPTPSSKINCRQRTPHTDPSPDSSDITRATDFHPSIRLWGTDCCNCIISKVQKFVEPLMLIFCICVLHVVPIDVDSINSFSKCAIDFENILNHSISWDND
jgi:hypothetical protein